MADTDKTPSEAFCSTRRTKGFWLGDFGGDSGLTEYRTSMVFIPWFLKFTSSWDLFLLSYCHLPKVFQQSFFLFLMWNFNYVSLDNRLVSKQPQWWCHATMSSQWGHVTNRFWILLDWAKSEGIKQMINHYLSLIHHNLLTFIFYCPYDVIICTNNWCETYGDQFSF